MWRVVSFVVPKCVTKLISPHPTPPPTDHSNLGSNNSNMGSSFCKVTRPSHCASHQQQMTNKRNLSERVEWVELPEILLPTTGKCIDTHIDNLRFRSVCTVWRSSILPFDSISRCRFPLDFPNLFPFPFPELLSDPVEADHYETFLVLFERKSTLHQSILYRLQRLHRSPSDKAWLVKVEGRKLCLFDPLSAHRERYELLNNFNLLDFPHLELTRAYSLEIEPDLIQFGSVNKVVMYPNSPSINLNDSHVFDIYNEGKLCHAKCGDESWTSVGEDRKDFGDVIVYEGRFYVVDRFGIVYWINVSSLGLQQFYPRISDGELGTRKYLVESAGALYVVDRYLIGRDRFKVYKLNEESDGSSVWDLMVSLGDRAFILGRDCSLSVSAGEFFGYERNCIYFNHQNQTHVFKLEDDSIANVDI